MRGLPSGSIANAKTMVSNSGAIVTRADGRSSCHPDRLIVSSSSKIWVSMLPYAMSDKWQNPGNLLVHTDTGRLQTVIEEPKTRLQFKIEFIRVLRSDCWTSTYDDKMWIGFRIDFPELWALKAEVNQRGNDRGDGPLLAVVKLTHPDSSSIRAQAPTVGGGESPLAPLKSNSCSHHPTMITIYPQTSYSPAHQSFALLTSPWIAFRLSREELSPFQLISWEVR